MKQSTVFPHFLHSNCIPGKLIFKTMQEYIVVYLKLSQVLDSELVFHLEYHLKVVQEEGQFFAVQDFLHCGILRIPGPSPLQCAISIFVPTKNTTKFQNTPLKGRAAPVENIFILQLSSDTELQHLVPRTTTGQGHTSSRNVKAMRAAVHLFFFLLTCVKAGIANSFTTGLVQLAKLESTIHALTEHIESWTFKDTVLVK